MIPYISAEDLEAILEEVVDPSDLITAIALDASCQAVRSYLGQEVNLAVDDVELRDGRGKYQIRLRQRPVREVLEVEIDDELLAEESWDLSGSVVRRIDGDVFPYGASNIAITYTHGWDTEEDSGEGFDRVPADIRLATLLIASRVYAVAGSQLAAAAGISSEKIGEYSYTIDAAQSSLQYPSVLPQEEFLLDPYRVPAVQR